MAVVKTVTLILGVASLEKELKQVGFLKHQAGNLDFTKFNGAFQNFSANSEPSHVQYLATPKALLPVGGKPAISWWLEYLEHTGFVGNSYFVTDARR
ncbi:hypothetical protein HK097_007173 [Rhizophlyctis rosea]|uniref:Uncharacterized protein n=1 Tax=Rhizophlyctis rosea TaxID=64517 RepID=A0AAD5SF22_9FUNG|nr:hypothetical protein HK097_007173 [Rhizophlyctis rosea]